VHGGWKLTRVNEVSKSWENGRLSYQVFDGCQDDLDGACRRLIGRCRGGRDAGRSAPSVSCLCDTSPPILAAGVFDTRTISCGIPGPLGVACVHRLLYEGREAQRRKDRCPSAPPLSAHRIGAVGFSHGAHANVVRCSWTTERRRSSQGAPGARQRHASACPACPPHQVPSPAHLPAQLHGSDALGSRASAVEVPIDPSHR
jgi:hypothetical protein